MRLVCSIWNQIRNAPSILSVWNCRRSIDNTFEITLPETGFKNEKFHFFPWLSWQQSGWSVEEEADREVMITKTSLFNGFVPWCFLAAGSWDAQSLHSRTLSKIHTSYMYTHAVLQALHYLRKPALRSTGVRTLRLAPEFTLTHVAGH